MDSVSPIVISSYNQIDTKPPHVPLLRSSQLRESSYG